MSMISVLLARALLYQAKEPRWSIALSLATMLMLAVPLPLVRFTEDVVVASLLVGSLLVAGRDGGSGRGPRLGSAALEQLEQRLALRQHDRRAACRPARSVLRVTGLLGRRAVGLGAGAVEIVGLLAAAATYRHPKLRRG